MAGARIGVQVRRIVELPVMMLLAGWFLPPARSATQRRREFWMALIGAASLVYALTKHASWRWNDVDTWGALALGVAVLAALAYPKWYAAFGPGSGAHDEAPVPAKRRAGFGKGS